MSPAAGPALPEARLALAIFFITLSLFAIAGLALINTGLGRSRSAAHSMLASLGLLAAAAGAYWICGFAWQGYPGRPAHVVTILGKDWSWLGGDPFFFRGLDLDGSPASLAAWLGMLGAGLAAIIPLGSAAERWRLSASCLSTALLAGWTYALFAHWVWGGGWLAQLGFLDTGGAAAIHAVGGLTALAMVWILGPRRGKFAPDGMPVAMPGHNAVFILFGCLLALLGWLGLNAAVALVYHGAGPTSVVRVAVNTLLNAAGGSLAAAAVTRLRFGKPDASLSANGWIAGLVAGSAGAALFAPVAAIGTGFIAGVLVTWSVEWLELHLGIDDPGGSISVHAAGGIWGLLAVALVGVGPWIAQLVGVATLLGCVLPLSYGLNWLLNRVHPQRVAPEGERQGIDIYELGAGAYPEFLTHTEEFTQR